MRFTLSLRLYSSLLTLRPCLLLCTGGLELRLNDDSDLKTFVKIRGLGPDSVSVVGPIGV